jgi:hypothetical protein
MDARRSVRDPDFDPLPAGQSTASSNFRAPKITRTTPSPLTGLQAGRERRLHYYRA